jgi:DNA-binding NtrC family response regulator
MTTPASPENQTILLVDDEHAVRLIVLKILKRAKYNVIEAASGEEALKLADAHKGAIDLVVTDMFMPGMRGPEVIENLMVKRPGLRVLFMSGYADHDPKSGVPFGAHFLGKPFSANELAAAVESALRSNPVS